jgi:hypothetical protein
MIGTADDGYFTVNAIWFQIKKTKPITTAEENPVLLADEGSAEMRKEVKNE